MNRPRELTLGLCCLLVAGCTSGSDVITRERLFAMGTWVDLTFREADSAVVRSVVDEIEADLRRFERDYYAWSPGQLADLNARLRGGEPAEVDAELAALLVEAQRYSELSDRAFDPGLGELVELWGFHSSLEPPVEPPADSAIAQLLTNGASIASVEIDDRRVTSSSPGPTLDLGGIAKGAAVDLIVDRLNDRGIESALVNAGGDLRVIGRAGRTSSARAWRVGVRHPREAGLLGTIELASGEAAFSSGDYERFFEYEGERLHHILDPRTGRPVRHTRAVTVVASDGSLADAAATALFVAGPEHWRDVATALGIDAVLRVGADGAVELTAAMNARLTRAGGADSDIMAPSD